MQARTPNNIIKIAVKAWASWLVLCLDIHDKINHNVIMTNLDFDPWKHK